MIKNKARIINLRIADYIIRVQFQQTEWVQKANLLHRIINEYLHDFIAHNTHLKTDVHIKIGEISGIPFITKNGKTYSEYFEKQNDSTYLVHYHISIFELIQLLHLIVIDLLGSDGFLLHASGILIGQQAILFIGQSGSGKTTVAKMLGKRESIIADDCVAIKETKKGYCIYRIPWIEKGENNMIIKNRPYEILHIFSLKKNRPFTIKHLTPSEALREVVVSTWLAHGALKKPFIAIVDFCKQFDGFSELSWDLHNDKELLNGFRIFSNRCIIQNAHVETTTITH